jgi:transposase
MRCWPCCARRVCGIPRPRRPPTRPVVIGQVGIITSLNEQIAQLKVVVAEHFGRHPAADIYLSQPGFGEVLAARALGEFGDHKKRFTDARAGRTTPGRAPITRASGRRPS